MIVREKVIVDGIPYIWFTNLDDDGIREFFDLYADRIRESEPPKELSEEKSRERKVVFHIKCRMGFLDFRDGVCFWSASDEKHHVLYRTNHEWELWNARQQEIQELRDEQAVERAVELRLLELEDRHLAEKTDDAIKAGACAEAAAWVVARMDLRIKSKGIKGISCLWLKCSLQPWWVFAGFPASEYGIEFLRKHDSTPQGFARFAYCFAVHRHWEGNQCVEQTRRIYEEGMRMFPDDANLAAAACLFWRRMKHYDLAIKICSDAIKNGLKDRTKTGFEGRLKRLEKESKQFDASGAKRLA